MYIKNNPFPIGGTYYYGAAKTNIIQTIDRMQHELLALSHQIHDHPELGYEEHQAVASIRSFLEERGFQVETPYCGLDTSFKVVKKGKGPGPRIAFLAEYDALRGIGHGCGHNIIATCAVGAFMGIASLIDEYDGEVSIIGTPGGGRRGRQSHPLRARCL